MPAYAYKGRNSAGQLLEGVLEGAWTISGKDGSGTENLTLQK